MEDSLLLETANSSSVAEDKIIKAKSLWATNGAVIMAVRRPG